MRSLIVTLVSLFNVCAAKAYVPFNLDFSQIESCEVVIKAKDNIESYGFGQWWRGDSPVYVVIVAKNHQGQIVQEFGNEEGKSFEDTKTADAALVSLIESGICK